MDDADAAPRAGQRGGAPSGNVQDGHPDDSVLQVGRRGRLPCLALLGCTDVCTPE